MNGKVAAAAGGLFVKLSPRTTTAGLEDFGMTAGAVVGGAVVGGAVVGGAVVGLGDGVLGLGLGIGLPVGPMQSAPGK